MRPGTPARRASPSPSRTSPHRLSLFPATQTGTSRGDADDRHLHGDRARRSGRRWTPSCTPASGSSFNLGTTTVIVYCDRRRRQHRQRDLQRRRAGHNGADRVDHGRPDRNGREHHSATITFATNEGTLTCCTRRSLLRSMLVTRCPDRALGRRAHLPRPRDRRGRQRRGTRRGRGRSTPRRRRSRRRPRSASRRTRRGGSVVSFVVTAADDGVPLLPVR